VRGWTPACSRYPRRRNRDGDEVHLGTEMLEGLDFRPPRHQGLGDPARSVAIRAGLVIALIGMALAFLMTSPTANQLNSFRGIAGHHTVGLPDGGPGVRCWVGAPWRAICACLISWACTPPSARPVHGPAARPWCPADSDVAGRRDAVGPPLDPCFVLSGRTRATHGAGPGRAVGRAPSRCGGVTLLAVAGLVVVLARGRCAVITQRPAG
jgi:hypothetical protein